MAIIGVDYRGGIAETNPSGLFWYILKGTSEDDLMSSNGAYPANDADSGLEFYGYAGNDTITNAHAKSTIDAGVGNDTIASWNAHSSSVNGGVGDVGNIVLRDRRQLSQDGILIVVVTLNRFTGRTASSPDIMSRGFVYVRESEQLMDEARGRVLHILKRCREDQITDWLTIKTNIRDSLAQFLFEQTRRRPMILPIIVEV